MIDPIRSTGAGLPLAMVHGLFGLMPIGEQMAKALGPDHALFAIHARALTGNPHDSVEGMARDYLAELRTHRPRGPYMLGGMCAGALIALEMARQLRIDGETIATYRQTVLTAFQEVEDNVAALRILEGEAAVQDDAVKAAREAVAVAPG